MSSVQYPQHCSLARAAEILGERWTLLIVRELLLGQMRFVDLRHRLDGISSSVLTERLSRLELAGVVHRTELPPPAASVVYELTEDGQALRPTILELIRWGTRFLLPPRHGERIDPNWLRLAVPAYARQEPVPARSYELHIVGESQEVVLRVTGGASGTEVCEGRGAAELTITGRARPILALMAGTLDATEAVQRALIQVSGDQTALSDFPALFLVELGRAEGPVAL